MKNLVLGSTLRAILRGKRILCFLDVDRMPRVSSLVTPQFSAYAVWPAPRATDHYRIVFKLLGVSFSETHQREDARLEISWK